jgi:hypothetical protein
VVVLAPTITQIGPLDHIVRAISEQFLTKKVEKFFYCKNAVVSHVKLFLGLYQSKEIERVGKKRL